MLNVHRQLKNEKDELFQQQITSDPAAKKAPNMHNLFVTKMNLMFLNFFSAHIYK